MRTRYLQPCINLPQVTNRYPDLCDDKRQDDSKDLVVLLQEENGSDSISMRQQRATELLIWICRIPVYSIF